MGTMCLLVMLADVVCVSGGGGKREVEGQITTRRLLCFTWKVGHVFRGGS